MHVYITFYLYTLLHILETPYQNTSLVAHNHYYQSKIFSHKFTVLLLQVSHYPYYHILATIFARRTV